MKDKPSKSTRVGKKSPPSSAVRMKPGYFEEPVANVDELDSLTSPPLPGKTHPRRAMADVVPTSDDEVRMSHHHPSESGTIEFESDPETADAAADLASDLGADFLEAVTYGQNLSDVILGREQESPEEFIIAEEETGSMEEEETGDVEDETSAPPELPRRAKAPERSSPPGRAARSRTR